MQTKVWACTQSPPCIADFEVGGTLQKSMKFGSDFMVLPKAFMPRLRNWRLLGTSYQQPAAQTNYRSHLY